LFRPSAGADTAVAAAGPGTARLMPLLPLLPLLLLLQPGTAAAGTSAPPLVVVLLLPPEVRRGRGNRAVPPSEEATPPDRRGRPAPGTDSRGIGGGDSPAPEGGNDDPPRSGAVLPAPRSGKHGLDDLAPPPRNVGKRTARPSREGSARDRHRWEVGRSAPGRTVGPPGRCPSCWNSRRLQGDSSR
jgi:hypothetical protein